MPVSLNSVFLLHRRSLMWSVMRIVRDQQAAEDLAQETYLRARRAVEAGPIDHIEAFLHQTARNLAIDYLRRRRTRNEVEVDGVATDIDQVPSGAPSLESAVMEQQRLQAFYGALRRLPERVQTVVLLSRIEGWSNVKIAEHLNVSDRTVFNDLKLAMAHCRDALQRLDRL